MRSIGCSTGSGGTVSPTPFIGGSTPNAANLAGGNHAADEAPTRVRMPRSSTSGPAAEPSAEGAPPKVAGWLVATTVLAAVTFLAGLGLLLFGPMPEPRAAGAQPAAADAGPRPIVADAAVARATPIPPAGMVLALAEDGTPRCFVDVAPTSHGDLAAKLRERKKPKASQRAQPATRVSFEEARRYASIVRKRLVSLDEWRAAARDSGFQPAPGRMWEWVDDGAEKSAKRTVVRASGPEDVAQRSRSGGKYVTFRLALDL